MKNKFNVAPKEQRMSDGRAFASKGERDCYEMLKLMERAGDIRDLECQVTTELIPKLTHKTDFKCFDLKRNEPLWIEYKGFEDQRWRDIKKLWKHCGPGRLKVYKGYGLRMILVEEIIPNG